jgi:hypothetical protein
MSRTLLLVGCILISACSPAAMSTDGPPLSDGGADLLAHDMTDPVDLAEACRDVDGGGIACNDEMGRAAGLLCERAFECAAPSRCLAGAPTSDHGADCINGVCCQWVSVDNNDGTFTRFKNCGSGWRCDDVCTYSTIPADGNCPTQRFRFCNKSVTCLSGCDGGPGCDKS